ncbi:hypothetical protein [Laribacter hongkongensis]|uniref:hypothetical protein n=1 Tax=Laribacter hongkongensis TaxID=168471 RepID=UPI00358DB403
MSNRHRHTESVEGIQDHAAHMHLGHLLLSFAQQFETPHGGFDQAVPVVGGNCRIPDDHLSKRIWKLTLAREGLDKLLATLKAQSK